ncbi:ATP-binding protein [Polynucleobacter sp. MWH-Svant-W18]|uniref:ATP-binding protein n=1 Tax=Polynucleobacter sp. MWH-Svant-W18 TaxID=1855909 RepID=UPI001BFD177A|nr:ATP-binding protein [Polynucleobacter sp. MWH-Svant-W18]QWD77224.1 ATP-binding protein [Polynucleobacter sp. MWH-Svant-W18]
MATLVINAERSEVRTAAEWLHQVASQFEVPQNKAIVLDQCLDEVLMNIVMHGGTSAIETPVELAFTSTQGTAEITVSDSGKAFDPVNAPAKPRPSSLEDAEPGGLGLSIIRGLSNRLNYQYKNGRNVLTFGVSI